MKILIVGGGVGGPALAQFMKNDADITLIDKAPAWGNIGYAITIWGNGQRILEKLGIDHIALKDAYQLPWNAYEDNKGNFLKSITFDIFKKYGPTSVVMRSAVQKSLVKGLEGKINIRMNLTVSEIIQKDNKAEVTFSDGTKDVFDLVVGADGIHSTVREQVFGKDLLKYYGWSVYVFWVPKEFNPPKGALEFITHKRLSFIYPIEDGAVVMLAVVTKPQELNPNPTKEFLHELFKDFGEVLRNMIDSIPSTEHIFRDNLAYVDMEEWYKGRVVLLGDARHAVTPITGMGTSMALEDAFVLSRELKNVTAENIPLALNNYAKKRDARIKRFHKVSRFVENWTMIKSPFLAFLIKALIPVIPSSYFTKRVEKIVAEEI